MGLTLPINPQGYPGFQTVITLDYMDPPARGLELAQSILSTIYYTWMDLANTPLTRSVDVRQSPFTQFKYRFRPSLNQGTALTPTKIGLTSCWIFHNLLELERWPGHLLAIIHESDHRQRQVVGSVQIDNVARVEEPVSPADGDNNRTGGLSDVPINIAQRWLRCFQGAVHHSIVHWPSSPVTDDPQFSPQPEVARYTWPCYSPLVRDHFELFIYPDANAGQPHQLTWDKLMRFLLTWSIGVAKGSDSGHSTRLVEGGRPIVEASIFLQGVREVSD